MTLWRAGALCLLLAGLPAAAQVPATPASGVPASQPAQRSPYPPLAVPLIAVPANPPPPGAAAPLPPLAIPRPPVLTGCDATGCWDSNGARLNRVGPDLMSPRGPCNVQGNIASCPP